MSRKRLHSRMLGLLLVSATIALSASPASAGTYTINSCARSAAYEGFGWVGYERTEGSIGGTPYFFNSTDCHSVGFNRHFEPNGVAGGAYSAATFNAPVDTYIAEAKFYQSIDARAAGAYDAIYAEREDGTRISVANYIAGSQIGDMKYTMPIAGSPVLHLRTELGCQATMSTCAGMSGSAYGNSWQLAGLDITLVDPSNPAFSSIDGDGWTAQPSDRVAPITYTVTDKGSGVAKVHFLVDGVEHAVDNGSCTAGSYLGCQRTASGQFALDPTVLSEGQHTVSLVVDDLSGNSAHQQLAITVRRAPHVASGSPVTTTDPSANGGGSPAAGDTIGGNGGTWVGDGITYTYQWLRCDELGQGCAPIDGATGLNYTATAADVGHTLQFCVTAANSGGAVTDCSAPTPVVIAARPATGGPSTDRSGDASAGSGSTASPSPTTVGTGANAGGDRGAPNGSPASERGVLSAIANSRSSTQKVKFGKRVPITGRLVGPNGAPIAGAVLTVQVQTAVPGASMADAAQVVTGPDGRFKYTAPKGPSRVIRFGYRAYTADTSFADTTDVRLLVTAGVTMKATPKKVHNKHATVFRGRLLGKPIAKRGVVVDLQVFFRKKWRTFAAPRTNKAGAYKFKYRFMAGAATWKFRARVRKDSSYPYEIGYTAKPIKVKVVR